jgi:hypothetical protein
MNSLHDDVGSDVSHDVTISFVALTTFHNFVNIL